MPDLHELLQTYVNDHLAGATAGRDMFRRTAESHAGTELGAALSVLGAEVDEDRDTQLQIMADLGIEPSTPRILAGQIAEKLGRLKPNATVWSRSPLTDVVEIEGLRVAVAAKAAGWEALLAAAVAEPRLSRVQLEGLLARARDQADRLRTLHLQVARQRFTSAVGRQG